MPCTIICNSPVRWTELCGHMLSDIGTRQSSEIPNAAI